MFSRRAFLGTLAAPLVIGQETSPVMFGDADNYERYMGRWSRVLAQPFIRFANPPAGGRFLDVGSGTGVVAFTLAAQDPRCQVVGIDPSRQYVEYARKNNSFGSRVSFETGDAQSLSFPDSAFDASLSLLVFNFIPDGKRALAELKRVTKPGGPVAAAVWDYGDGMRMLQMFWQAAIALDPAAREHDESDMPFARAGQFRSAWTGHGLENVEERPLEIETRFRSLADYWEPFFLGTGPAGVYVRGLNSERREALRAELKRRLNIKSDDEPFTLTARAWAVRGIVPAPRPSDGSR